MHGLAGFDAYTNALALYRAVVEVGKRLPKGHVIDQLTRASESIALNVAEAHPAMGADRARRFRIASHEASEARGHRPAGDSGAREGRDAGRSAHAGQS